MKPIKLTIPGNTPSKKTGQRLLTGFVPIKKGAKLFRRVKSPKIMPGTKYGEWFNANKLEGIPCVSDEECPVNVKMYFVRDSRRKFDYNNVSQSVMDLLKDRAVIPDDNAYVCKPVYIGFEVDKENPRVDVEIVSMRDDAKKHGGE